MTPQEEIQGLKNILNAWKKDSEHYRAALVSIRELTEPYLEPAGILSAIYKFCDSVIKHDEQCDICGDHHETGEVPRECETGDGI